MPKLRVEHHRGVYLEIAQDHRGELVGAVMRLSDELIDGGEAPGVHFSSGGAPRHLRCFVPDSAWPKFETLLRDWGVL